jgi:hypothetical protein
VDVLAKQGHLTGVNYNYPSTTTIFTHWLGR